MPKPYILTDDLCLVFSDLSTTRSAEDLTKVLSYASDRITAKLEEIYPRVERISSERMSTFVNRSIMANSDPVISLIPLTHAEDFPGRQIEKIESSRTVKAILKNDEQIIFEDLGSMPRNSNMPCLKEQFKTAAVNINGHASSVHLVDDVVFSGGTIVMLADQLKKHGIEVQSVIANVAITDGLERLNKHGIVVNADFVYDDVIDEVCMRDFIIGAPAGGRNLLLNDKSYACIPYVSPFGDVEGWASITREHVADFSRVCLESSLSIWEEIGPDMRFKDLPKPVFGCQPNETITKKIETMLERKAYEQRTRAL